MEPVAALTEVPLHVPMTVVNCLTDPVLRSRLTALGLRHGAVVTVVQVTPGGGRVVDVAGSHIALDQSVLSELQVKVRPARDGSA